MKTTLLRRRALALVGTIGLATAMLITTPAIAGPDDNPSGTTTSTGQGLDIEITSPTAGASLAAGPVTVDGTTTLGPLTSTGRIGYIVDVSGSTGSHVAGQECDGVSPGGQSGDDLNGNGSIGEIIDCEIAGVIAINDSLAGSAADAAVIPFNHSASTSPTFSPVDVDGDINGRSDVEDYARTLTPGGATDFDAPLEELRDFMAAAPAGTSTLLSFFLTDGYGPLDTSAGSPVHQVAGLGVVVNTFAIGSAVTCSPTENIRKIADITGGTCTEVSDPSTLAAALTQSVDVSAVEVSVNGGPFVAATDTSGAGDWSTWTEGSGVLVPGDNEIDARVTASDGTTTTAHIHVDVTTNTAPDCSAVTSDPTEIWPPNHRMVPVMVDGGSDADGDPLTYTVTSVFQDEEVNAAGDGNTAPDAEIHDDGSASVRAERSGTGNGRFYHLSVDVSDGIDTCTADLTITVAKSKGQKGAAVDDGALYDSTIG